jgi:hypothetical protein
MVGEIHEERDQGAGIRDQEKIQGPKSQVQSLSYKVQDRRREVRMSGFQVKEIFYAFIHGFGPWT